MPGKKDNIKTSGKSVSVKYKLYLSLVLINAFALIIGFTAWSAFRSSGNTMRMITEDMIPITESVSEVIVLSARLSNLFPRLIFVQTEEDLERTYQELSGILNDKKEIMKVIKGEVRNRNDFSTTVFEVDKLNDQMNGFLWAFKQDISALIKLNQRQVENTKIIAKAHADFIAGTSPISDDAQFELIIGLENANDSREKLVNQAENLALVLKIKAEGNLLAGIVETALHYEEQEGIAPLEERFDATLNRLQGHLVNIDQDKNKFSLINNAVMVMKEMGGNQNNIFDIQKERLRKNTILQKDLKDIENITNKISVSVNKLADHIKQDVEKTKKETDLILKIGTLTISLVSFISIIFTLILSWFYIRNRVIGRIDKLKSGMRALADKDFEYPIEGGNNYDEIGQMANALVTFREKLIENEVLTQDIKIAMEESVEAKNKMSAILNATGDGIYALNINGYTTIANSAAKKMLGYTFEEMAEKSQHDLIHHSHLDGSPYPIEDCNIYKSIHYGETSYVENEVFWRQDGTSFPVSYHSTPIIDKENHITGAVVSFQDITERKEKERMLRHAKKHAEYASQAKSEFLANMSHELRTPLNSIMGMSQILTEDMTEGEERDMVQTVNNSACLLLDTVNDILDLSKIEAKQMTLENIGFDFRETLASVIETLAPIASKKSVWLNYSYKKDNLPFIKGDPVRLGRVLTNLISNAIKYTLEGKVEVMIDFRYLDKKRDEIELKCSVIDTGIGIPEDKHEAVFQKFTQADESTTRQFGGTGLGLAITKDFIGMMDGEIGIQSAEGKGSTFWFKIPFKTTGTLHDEARESKTITGIGAQHDAINKINIEKANILIAEDHELNQIFIKKLLKRMGIKTYKVVTNGLTTIEEYNTGAYNLILMDCHMPEMNGYQATEEIRRLEKENDKHIPIIALTADAMVGTREKCTKIGMNDYVSKPIDANIFKDVLGRWFILSDGKSAAEESPPPANHENILDLSTIKEYADTDEELNEYCTIFFLQTEESIAQLKEQCTDGKNIKWSEISHKVKGGAGMIGAIQLHKLAEEAQNMTEVSNKQRQDHLARIKTAYESAKSFLQSQVLTG